MYFFKLFCYLKRRRKRKKIGKKETTALNNAEGNEKVSPLLYLKKSSINIMNISSDTKESPVLRKSLPKMLMFFFFLNLKPL